MKPSDFVKYGAGLAFNTAYNYLKPNSQEPIGSQIQLYRNMKFYMKKRQGSRTRTVVKRRRRARRGGGSAGIIGPLIPRPVKPSPPSKYDLYGSRGQDEVYRQCERPSIGYIGFTSFKCTKKTVTTPSAISSVSGSLTYHVAAALCRFILKREYKQDFMRHSQKLVFGVTNGARVGPRIAFVRKDVGFANGEPTFEVSHVIDIDTFATFKDLCENVAVNVIGGANFGGVTTTSGQADRYSLFGYFIVGVDSGVSQGGGGIANWADYSQSGIVRLDDMYIKAYSTAELALQNITVADGTAGDGQWLDNRIDSNPLQCRMFKFNTPMPKIREYLPDITIGTADTVATAISVSTNTQSTDSFMLHYDQQGDGVIIPNSVITFNNDFDQLPPAHKFAGCVGVSDFKLMPGEIRKFKLRFKYDGLLTRFISGQGLHYADSGSRMNTRDALGTSCLIAVEKVLSTGISTNVTFNMQCSYFAGAYCKKPKMNILLPYDKDGTYVSGPDNLGNPL